MTRKTTRKTALPAVVGIAFAFASAAFAGSVASRVTSIPEHSTLALLGSGLLGIAFVVRRKRKLILMRQVPALPRQVSRPPLSQSSLTIDQTAA